METNEKIIFKNLFGLVTDKRVTLNYKSGAEDIPIGQITSVSYQHKRNYFFLTLSFIMTIGGIVTLIATISNMEGFNVLFILVIIIIATLSGIAHWIGHNNIQISAGGNDRKPLRVEMSKIREGREFVDAVKKSISK
jgi:hypothetical protein